MQLVLSTFSGIGLLDKAFRDRGFVVVSAGDLITGQDIRDFTGIKGRFNGVIGGSPCQDFSGLKREKTDYSLKMVYEFLRIVGECEPDWYLLENVKGVPNIPDLVQDAIVERRDYFDIVNQLISVRTLEKYSHQRLDINQGWYDEISRLRHIQFGSTDNLYLDIPRGEMKDIEYNCALASDDRSFKELCFLQGLDQNFNLPDFNLAGKKKVVGNGVPLSIGRVLADAVAKVTELHPNNVTVPGIKSVSDRSGKNVTDQLISRCDCGCGRPLTGRKKYYDASCRKRAQRKRDKQR